MESELFNFDIIKPIIVNLLSKFDKKIMTTIGSTGGRNILGRVCIFHRGGGKKRLYRPIDFIRRVNDYGTVIKIYKAAKRTAFIGTILYLNGLLSNLLMAENSRIGSLLFNGTYIPKEYAAKDAHGWTVPIQYCNLFSIISNIERIPFKGSQIVRAAGGSAVLATLKKTQYTIKLSSGWQLIVTGTCLATLGKLSNFHHRYESRKKAGVVRNLGIRPTVRGVVKNPCDHPHGGGEGKGSPPRAQVSPWGKLTKGTPTNNKIKDRLNRRLYRTL